VEMKEVHEEHGHERHIRERWAHHTVTTDALAVMVGWAGIGGSSRPFEAAYREDIYVSIYMLASHTR
jgi:hypothetical protein